jgi:hypothetical protein
MTTHHSGRFGLQGRPTPQGSHPRNLLEHRPPHHQEYTRNKREDRRGRRHHQVKTSLSNLSPTAMKGLGNREREPGKLQNRPEHHVSLQSTSANRPSHVWIHWPCKSLRAYRNKWLIVVQQPPDYKRPPTL